MSLITLLEAARYLEMQEQHRATVEAALAATKPLATTPIAPPPAQVIAPTINITNNTLKSGGTHPPTPQTVVISSSNITSTILQGPITLTQPQIVNNNNNKKDNSSNSSPEHQVSSTTSSMVSQNNNNRTRILHNSFDIMNPLIIDETNGESKRKQPPLVFRAGTREVHNKLEKHRRAHLKECFDALKKQLPSNQDEKKTSNLSILHSALRFIQTLKRKERELEHEMERLAREKIASQQRLAVLKKEISTHYDNVDFSKLLPEVVPVTPNVGGVNGGSTDGKSEVKVENHQSQQHVQQNGAGTNGGVSERIAIPLLTTTKTTSIPVTSQGVGAIKEVTTQPVQTALSVLPMSYPVNQGLVLQKVAIVPKGLTDLTPLMSTHFITTPQQLNGKVVPLAQYLVKPAVVVVSTASPRPS